MGKHTVAVNSVSLPLGLIAPRRPLLAVEALGAVFERVRIRRSRLRVSPKLSRTLAQRFLYLASSTAAESRSASWPEMLQSLAAWIIL